MAERNNAPPRMTALGLLEQMRRANANREPEFNPISATLRERREGPARGGSLFGGQRQQAALPIPPTPPAVIPPPPPQRAAPLQAAVAPQARTPAQALPVPPRPPQLGADGNPIPPALLPQVPGAEPMPMHERFNPENPYVATAIQMAERYNLPRNVFLSVINQESRFRPDAVSRVGALGPGQLMPGTARDMGVDPRDPMQNIEGSARYLRSMLDLHKGDMPLALASYNAGPGRVQRAGNTIPNIPETQKYVPEVLRNAGVPGYAEGGLAHLEQKYSEGGPVASLPTYDINVRANRIRTPRRPAPREELTADQLNDMVLDALARRAAAASEAGAAAEARDRIRQTMGYAEGGLAELEHKYEGGGPVSLLTGLARRMTRRTPALRTDEVPMVAMHNAREVGLKKIADNGGVVVAPSIGISRADDPMTGFGEISLIASPQTIDPRRTPVYARDAYTPRYPSVIPMTVRGRDKEYVRLYNDDTGESRLLPHTPRNALRVMTNDPWRGGEDFITDNWLLGQMTPQFRNMSELRGARDRLVPSTDKSVEDWQNQLGALRQEFRDVLPDSIRDNFNFIDSHTRNMAEAAQRGPGGMEYINRTYYNNAIPEDLLERTRAHLEAGRDLPTIYFEAKPRRIVPLNEFQGAMVPVQASKDVTDLLRRYGVDDIRYYNRFASKDDAADRTAQIRQFERYMFGAAPVAAGAAVEAAADAPEPEGYAEGGRVNSDWSQYLPEDMPESAYIDHRNTMTRPLNVRRLIDAGAIRITDPAGDPSGEGFSVVSRWNDVSPESVTPRWADRPSALPSAINALSSPGSLVDGKYRQILQSARELGLSPDEVFLPERESRAEAAPSLEELDQRYAEGGRVGRLLGAVRRAVTNEAAAPPMERGVVEVVERVAPEAQVRAFHGSFAPSLAELDNARLGENFNNRGSRAGHWFSTNPDDAAFFGDNIYETILEGRYKDLPSMEQIGENVINRLRQTADNPNVSFDTRQRAEEFLNFVASTRDPNFYTNSVAAELSKARRDGYDGAVLRGGETVQANSAPGDHYVVFDPSRARIQGRYENRTDLEELDQKYARGGDVMSDEEYDRRLLERMKRDTGRTTESTNAEQARALRSAGYDAAQLASDIFMPQSPLDAALMVAFGPGGRMARLAGSTALMAMEPSEAEAGTRFVRRSQSFDSPFNKRARHIAMFAETKNPRETLDQLKSYGPAAWITRGDDAVDVRDIQPDIVRALRNSGIHEDYNTTAAALARNANPENIINSAGLWDDPLLVREVYENVIQPREITSVRTNDGLLVFDPVNVRPIRTEYAHGGLAQLHHKYAEGGAVSAQPAIYDPDAVNALANQIEAGYV